MFFKKNEQAEVQELVKLDQADRKTLADLEEKFRALEPEWTALQERAEYIRSLYNAGDDVYDRGISEVFWAERPAKQKAEIAALIAERDELTRPVIAQIADVRGRIDQRHAVVVGAFNSWASQVSGVLPADVAGGLQAARRECASQDLAAVVDVISSWVEKAVEAAENAVVPLVNWAKVVRQAAEKGLV